MRTTALSNASRTGTNHAAATRAAARGKRFALVASGFHPALSRALVRGASRALSRAGVPSDRIRVLWAPGAFELPVLAAWLARRRPRPDAIVALGCLIRGETAQYEVIAHAVAQGLCQVGVEAAMPVTFGIVVAETLAQAKARAGLGLRPRHGLRRPRRGRGGPARPGAIVTNRGEEAAEAALAMLRLFERTE